MEMEYADVVYFYTEESDKVMRVHLQCDKSAVDAGILLVSGTYLVGKEEMAGYAEEWQTRQARDGRTYDARTKKVDTQTFAKILMQGATEFLQPINKQTGYFFITLDEQLEESFFRATQHSSDMYDSEERLSLFNYAFDGSRRSLFDLLTNNIDLTTGTVKSPAVFEKLKTSVITQYDTDKVQAQAMPCNIEIKRRYDLAIANEKGNGLSVGPTSK